MINALPFRLPWMPREELAPVIFPHVDVVLLRRRPDSPPGVVALLICNAFHLVKPRNRVPHMCRVVDGLFALLGKANSKSGRRSASAVLMLPISAGRLLREPAHT
jgi:hypothetical protein